MDVIVYFMDENFCFMDENFFFMDENFGFKVKNTDLWMKICSAGPARSRPGGPGGAGAGPERRNLSRGVRRSESARNVGRSDVP